MTKLLDHPSRNTTINVLSFHMLANHTQPTRIKRLKNWLAWLTDWSPNYSELRTTAKTNYSANSVRVRSWVLLSLSLLIFRSLLCTLCDTVKFSLTLSPGSCAPLCDILFPYLFSAQHIVFHVPYHSVYNHGYYLIWFSYSWKQTTYRNAADGRADRWLLGYKKNVVF